MARTLMGSSAPVPALDAETVEADYLVASLDARVADTLAETERIASSPKA